jgi:hypothetical protein
LPAVTVPFAAKAGFSLASASALVSARGPSSSESVRFSCLTSPVASSGLRVTISIGVISSLNPPAFCAAMAF